MPAVSLEVPTPSRSRPSASTAQADVGLRQRLRTLAHALTVAEARERQRIAQDLHDDIGQLLVAAQMQVHELRRCPPTEQPARLDELFDVLQQATRATRSATFDLGSPALALGLDEALRSLAEHLRRRGAAACHVDAQMPEGPWSQPVLAVLYRVARELGLNAQRHAQARQISLRLGVDAGQIFITVSDDGVGMAPDWAQRGVRRDGGYGLLSSHAQMQALGGALQVESGAGSGTLATVTLPLQLARPE